jgi:large subunit ribosomal protein L25
MTEFNLKAIEKTEKANKLRQDGKIPAIVYGHKFEPLAVAVDVIDFQKVFKEAGTSNLIDLAVGDKKLKVLLHDSQKDPMNEKLIHLDFLKVNMKEKIHAEIPLEFVGDSDAVINKEGSLITPVDSIEVECLPGDLISEITVDVSILDDFEKNIKVSDLKLPEGVELLSDPEEIIAFVQEPRSEEELEALNEEVVENVEAIEVENKGEDAPVEGEAEGETEGKTPPAEEDKKAE